AAVFLGGPAREATPAAAEVEHAHAGLEAGLTAHEIELGFLRLRERLGLVPVRTRIDHPRIEHPRVEIVADVVVGLDRRAGTSLGLEIEQQRLERECSHAPAARDLLL